MSSSETASLMFADDDATQPVPTQVFLGTRSLIG
jgi:hypothetical protein